MNRDLAWLIFFFLIIGVIWSVQQKPDFDSGAGQTTQKPSTSFGTKTSGQTASSNEVIQSAPPTQTEKESWEGLVYIRQRRAKKDDPQKEYIELQAKSSTKKPIPISGWTLSNKRNAAVTIPKGAELAFSAQVNPEQTIFLNPGDKAIIVTGESPIGANFRINKCTGYFKQFQEFEPSISLACPRPRDEFEGAGLDFDDVCFNYVKTLPRCKTPLSNIQQNISSDCRSFILNKLTYAGCVDAHKNDDDFFKKEWRIYLGRSNELWSNVREKIKLFDINGNLVNEITY